MLVRDQEAVVIGVVGRLLSHDTELVCSQGQKSLQHVGQQDFNLLTLLGTEGDSDAVDGELDEAFFLVTLGDDEGLQKEGGVVLEFDLGVSLAFDQLRGEVSEVEEGIESVPD